MENEQIQWESADEEARTRTQAKELVAAYVKQVSPEEGQPIAVETRLHVPLIDPVTGEDFGIPLLGVIDLVLAGADGPVICDFKTSAKSNNPVEILHEVQLTAYSYLFRHMARDVENGLEIRSLIKTKTPKVECHRYASRSGAHFRRFFQLIRAYLDDLDSGRFVYRPGWTCAICEFRNNSCAEWAG